LSGLKWPRASEIHWYRYSRRHIKHVLAASFRRLWCSSRGEARVLEYVMCECRKRGACSLKQQN